MPKYRSRLVVDVKPRGDGTYNVFMPDGRVQSLTKEQLDAEFQPIERVLDWSADDCPGPGKLYDAHGEQINKPVCYADLDEGWVIVLTRENGLPVRRREFYAPPLRFVSDATR